MTLKVCDTLAQMAPIVARDLWVILFVVPFVALTMVQDLNKFAKFSFMAQVIGLYYRFTYSPPN